MLNFISLFIGAMTALMIVVNGRLSEGIGLYESVVLIHIVGLVMQSTIMVVKKSGVKLRRGIPLWVYGGGAVGILTVIFTNYAFTHLGVASAAALNLLGMTISSILIDQFGWLGMQKHKLTTIKLISLLILLVGVVVLLYPYKLSAILAVVLSILSGVTVVVSRTLNARMLLHYDLQMSTLFNYITGLFSSSLVLLVLSPIAFTTLFSFQLPWYTYIGGAIGAVLVSLSSVVAVRLPSYSITVVMFLGQFFFGMALDALTGRTPTPQAVAGGVILAIGLFVNYYQPGRRERQLETKSDGR